MDAAAGDDAPRRVTVVDGQAEAVFDASAYLAQPEVAAQVWAHITGVGRLTVGAPGSPRRRDAAAEVVAAVLRRVARRAGVANRLRTEREPGPADDEVTVRWPVDGREQALAAEVASLVAALGQPADDGAFLAAVRDAGDAIRS